MEGKADTLSRRIRQARLLRDLSQTDLARRVECTQAAISRVEGGELHAVSATTLQRICAALGLETSGASETESLAGICPSAGCLQNAPYLVSGELRFLARWFAGAKHCPYCGTAVISACPHCRAAIRADGAFCRDCGKPWIETPPHLRDLPDPRDYEETFAKRWERLRGHRTFDRGDA